MTRCARAFAAAPWVLAALLLAACGSEPGGSNSSAAAPGTNQGLGDASASAAADAAIDESAAPTSKRFSLGTNYIRLSPTQPTSSSPTQIEVAEVFGFGCADCYQLEADLKTWLAGQPNYVHFIRVPAVWTPELRLGARAFYTAEALNETEIVREALFEAMHTHDDPLASKDTLAAFFARFGVANADFEKTFDSYAVQEQMQRADALDRRYRVVSIPSMVVNGKYVTNEMMAGGLNAMLALVDELVASERAAETAE